MGFTWNETITPKVIKAKKIHIDSDSPGAYASTINQSIKDLLDNKHKCNEYSGFEPSTIIVPTEKIIKYNDGKSIYDLAEDFQKLATYCATALNPHNETTYNPHNPNYYTTVQSAPYQPVVYGTHCSSNNTDKCSTHNESK